MTSKTQSTIQGRKSQSQAGPSSTSAVHTASLPAAGGVEWADRFDVDLRRYVVRQNRPLVLMGRSARSSRTAVRDLHNAAASLAWIAGMDVRPALPDEDALVELLGERRPGRSGSDAPGRNLFVDLPGSGVLLFLSSGSPSHSLGTGPFHMQVLTSIFSRRRSTLAGVYASKLDRYVRDDADLPVFLNAVRRHDARGMWAGDGAMARWHLHDPRTAVMLTLVGSISAREAKQSAARRRRPGERLN